MALATVAFSTEDCELFERYPSRVPFKDEHIPQADKDQFRDLRLRLKALVTSVAEEVATSVPLRAEASTLSPNGRSPIDLWACAFPRSVPNKSYGLQLAMIVSAQGIELCCCLGAGQSQVKNRIVKAEAEVALARLKAKLRSTPEQVQAEVGSRLTRRWDLRRSWREQPGTKDFEDLGAWLAYAGSSEGNAASISLNIARDVLPSAAPSTLLLGLGNTVAPLLEYAYGGSGRIEAPAPRRGAKRAASPAPRSQPSQDLAPLASSLHLEARFLRDIVRALKDRGQVILYGPPGTGKTFVARKLIEHLAPDASCRDVVQFHPSYSYEDFVLGFRPQLNSSGDLAYRLQEGPLLRLARHAAAHPRQRHVLLVDEINRGNLPRIFGELLYLLEYRDEWISLMYTPAPELRVPDGPIDEHGRFRLPPNLLLVATMNTADRSIGLIDAALRRRFHFVPFFPGEGALDGLLARWLQATQGASVQGLADWVDRLNALLRDDFGRHLQIGHSYFMRSRLTLADVERIWAADIMPFLEDQMFGHPDGELRKYELARIRRSNDRDVLSAAGDADASPR